MNDEEEVRETLEASVEATPLKKKKRGRPKKKQKMSEEKLSVASEAAEEKAPTKPLDNPLAHAEGGDISSITPGDLTAQDDPMLSDKTPLPDMENKDETIPVSISDEKKEAAGKNEPFYASLQEISQRIDNIDQQLRSRWGAKTSTIATKDVVLAKAIGQSVAESLGGPKSQLPNPGSITLANENTNPMRVLRKRGRASKSKLSGNARLAKRGLELLSRRGR